MLPWIREAALGFGDVLDTLGSRAGVFDKIGAGMRGFVQGLGFDGGIREAVTSLGDLLFGANDGSGAADRLGAIFMKAKEWGAAVRELSDAIKGSPIAGFLATLGSYGMSFAVAAIGIGLLAGAISGLAKALYLLSGAKFAVGLLKQLGKLTKWATAAEAVDVAKNSKGGMSRWLKGAGQAILAFGRYGARLAARHPYATAALLTAEWFSQLPGRPDMTTGDGHAAALRAAETRNGLGLQVGSTQREGGLHRIGLGEAPPIQPPPTPTAAQPQNDVAAQLRAVTLQTRSTGVSDVNVTNPQPATPPPISLVINVANAMDGPPAAAKAVADAIASAVQSVVAGRSYERRELRTQAP